MYFVHNSSLIAIMKKSSKGGKGSPKLEQPAGKFAARGASLLTAEHFPVVTVSASAIFLVPEAADDVKVKAVNEMMERIKHGVVLRPVKGQDTKVFILILFVLFVITRFTDCG